MDPLSLMDPLRLERIALSDEPTPIEPLDEGLWVKREDRAGTLYGGNKVRKLEYLLPEARRRGDSIVTIGATGSHHLVASTVYGKAHGVPVIAVTFPQPDTAHVRENNACLRRHATELIECDSDTAAGWVLLREGMKRGRMGVWAGGSVPMGVLGWVRGGLEIASQVQAGAMPEPEAVYVALGSCGTAAGLMVGLPLGGLKTRVVAVRVVGRTFANATITGALARSAARLMARNGVETRGLAPLEVIHDQFGAGYGHETPAGKEALDWAEGKGLHLEPTYTAKALAAARADPRRPALFLDSVNSRPLP